MYIYQGHFGQISGFLVKICRRWYILRESTIKCNLVKKGQKWAKKGQKWAKLKFSNRIVRNNIKYIYMPNFRVLGWPKQDLWPFWTSFWSSLTPSRDHFRAIFRKVLGIFAFLKNFWNQWKNSIRWAQLVFWTPDSPPLSP